MSSKISASGNASYSEIAGSAIEISLTPPFKEDDKCNLCNQPLKKVKSRDFSEREFFFFCPGCKVVKQFLEDNSVKIVLS